MVDPPPSPYVGDPWPPPGTFRIYVAKKVGSAGGVQTMARVLIGDVLYWSNDNAQDTSSDYYASGDLNLYDTSQLQIQFRSIYSGQDQDPPWHTYPDEQIKLTQLSPYTWRFGWEDMGIDGLSPDWDYNDAAIDVAVIKVPVLTSPTEGEGFSVGQEGITPLTLTGEVFYPGVAVNYGVMSSDATQPITGLLFEWEDWTWSTFSDDNGDWVAAGAGPDSVYGVPDPVNLGPGNYTVMHEYLYMLEDSYLILNDLPYVNFFVQGAPPTFDLSRARFW